MIPTSIFSMVFLIFSCRATVLTAFTHLSKFPGAHVAIITKVSAFQYLTYKL